MNKLSPLLLAALSSSVSVILIYFISLSIPISIDQFNLLIFCGVIFVLLVITTYLLLRIFIYTKLKHLYFTIRKHRKADLNEYKKTNATVFNNINEEIRLWAAERKEEVDRLNKLETYRKEYLGNVSHELKTPIFNIQGYLSTLLDGGLEDNTINKDYLQRAETSVERMIGIIDDLEAITQLESGQLELEFEKFDIVLLSKEIAHAGELKAAAKKIELTVAAEKPVFVIADKFRIRQVLTNLIVNSVNYGKEHGETKIRFFDVGENIRIEIADNGIGIDEKHLPRLFERFYRVDKHRSRGQGGTGLGLAIVKHILEAHNQTINVMSTEGAGTVFSFALKKAP